MRNRTATRIGTTALTLAAGAALAFPLLGATQTLEADPRGEGCRGANIPAQDATPKELRAAIKCLINRKREARNRRPLRGNRALGQIARRHTQVMLETNCFEHRCGDERPLKRRIAGSDYLKGGGRFGYGENLGCASTPKVMFREWMQSRFHKRNILKRRYRHMGIGALHGAPAPAAQKCPPAESATYTVLAAWRKR